MGYLQKSEQQTISNSDEAEISREASEKVLLHRGKSSTLIAAYQKEQDVDINIDSYPTDVNPYEVKVISFTHKDANSKTGNTTLYIPGTAFIKNETSFTYSFCSLLAKKTNSKVIALIPPVLPEASLSEAVDSLNNEFLKLYQNPENKNIVLTGYCSGAYFAAMMALSLKSQGITIKGLHLFSPVMDFVRQRPYQYDNIEDKDETVSEQLISWSVRVARRTILRTDNHSGISKQVFFNNPPATIASLGVSIATPINIWVGENDRCYHDSMLTSEHLENANIRVALKVLPNADHGYLWHNEKHVDTICESISVTFGAQMGARKKQIPIAEPFTPTGKKHRISRYGSNSAIVPGTQSPSTSPSTSPSQLLSSPLAAVHTPNSYGSDSSDLSLPRESLSESLTPIVKRKSGGTSLLHGNPAGFFNTPNSHTSTKRVVKDTSSIVSASKRRRTKNVAERNKDQDNNNTSRVINFSAR